MTAKIYQLSSNLHWYLYRTIDNVSNEEFKEIEAFKEQYQGQVRVEYN